VFDVPLKPSTNLTGSIDVEALLAGYPADYLVKGMFCNRFVDVLGADFEALQPRLIAPPRGGRYLPFRDYPQADYSRIAFAAAAKQFPQLDLAEATRRAARDDFGTFASSTMGKIMLALVGDTHSALLRMPEAFALIATGAELRTEERGAHSVRMILVRYVASVEYMLGQLEGIVMSYQRSPVTTIHRLDRATLTFDVEHG
jgi:uncharacterized protein (TIGR02265 family)